MLFVFRYQNVQWGGQILCTLWFIQSFLQMGAAWEAIPAFSCRVGAGIEVGKGSIRYFLRIDFYNEVFDECLMRRKAFESTLL